MPRPRLEARPRNAQYAASLRRHLSDIKDNSYIGVTGMPQADGSQKAVEIHIFPEPMRKILVTPQTVIVTYVPGNGQTTYRVKMADNVAAT